MQLHHSDDGCQYTSFRFGKRCRASYPLSARYAHTTIGYGRFGSSQRSSLPRSLSLILGSRRGSCRVLESAEVISYNLLKFFMKMAPRVGIELTCKRLIRQIFSRAAAEVTPRGTLTIALLR